MKFRLIYEFYFVKCPSPTWSSWCVVRRKLFTAWRQAFRKWLPLS